MAAAITFFGGVGAGETGLGASGVGFYGATFGSSVQVASYQDTTFITDTLGTTNGGQIDNNKYLGTSSGVKVNAFDNEILANVPTISGTLNVRFTFDTPVMTQNGEFRIFDRADITLPATGVTCWVAMIGNGGSGVNQTTGEAQAGHNGWAALSGASPKWVLLASPGESGLSPNGTGTNDDRHDWYISLSATPTSIGSKTDFGAYVALEYL
jgi:hypothetical protein